MVYCDLVSACYVAAYTISFFETGSPSYSAKACLADTLPDPVYEEALVSITYESIRPANAAVASFEDKSFNSA